MYKFLCFLTGLIFSVMVSAQQGAGDHSVNLSLLDNAISQLEANSELTEEERNALLDSYRRSKSYIKNTQASEGRAKAYRSARETAFKQAAELQTSLDARMEKQGKADPEPVPDPKLRLTEVEQQIQRDKAELAAIEARLSDISNQLQSEVERPIAVRQRLTELKTRQDELAGQIQLLPPIGKATSKEAAQRWLLEAEAGAVAAELTMLDEELLSQPMRLDLLKVQQDSGSFEKGVLEAHIKFYEQFAIELHKGAAQEAQSAAQSAEEEAEGKHPLILELAESNTELGERATAVAGELESVKDREAIANDQAQRFETDLRAVMQKLEIIGMSQALGQILREQQARLPSSRFSRTDASGREQLIAESSLRQLEYEEERHQLRSAKVYIVTLTAELPPEEAEQLHPDLTELAKARRTLIDQALEVESAYLRSLGDLDFSTQRLRRAASAYREFIDQRLLWIRTTEPLSWSTFVELPNEIAEVLDPRDWLGMIRGVATLVTDNPLYLAPFILLAILIRARPIVRRRLRATGDDVGKYQRDEISLTLLALLYTFLLALTWPFALWSLGLIVAAAADDMPLAEALGTALMRISYFFIGMEFFRQMLRPDGLVIRHFHWAENMCRKLALELRTLERVFVPAVLAGILPARLHPIEGGSVLSMFCLIVALIAIARFFYRIPRFMKGRFDTLLSTKAGKPAPIWGRLVRWILIIIPCVLIVCMLLGYGNTAISFLGLLLYTNGLIAALVVLQEVGGRWFRILRRRIVAAEAAKQREEAQARLPGDEGLDEDFGELDTESLDDEARKLLSAVLTLIALVGTVGIWSDVMPALGILDSVELWHRTATVGGQDSLVPVTLGDIGISLVMLLVGTVIVRRVPNVLEIVLRQKLSISHGTVYAATTLFRYTMIAIIVIVVAGNLGGSWSSIQWAVAALSVGIGFGLQEIVANFISGLILLFEQPIRVGDTVTVGETSGIVTRIRMRATTIRDWNRRELLVPNKEFITGRLLNWSLSDQLTRFEVVIGVAYGTDLKKAMDLAVQVAQENPEILNDPAPFVTFDDFGDNSLKLVLRCFLDSVDRRLTISSGTRVDINRRFVEEGIVIAFPQRDVHLDASEPLDITIRHMDPPGAPS